MTGYMKNFAVLIAMCFSTLAQGIPSSIETILKQTMAADGQLTKQMHHQFWQEIKKLGTNKENTYIYLLYAQEYQKELWESAKISCQNNRVVKTKRLIDLEIELPTKFEQSLSYSRGSADYQSAMNGYKKTSKVSMENSTLLLQSAATHQPITSVEGQVITVNMELINIVLKNLSASFTRLQNLLDEDWSPTQPY